MKILLLLEHDDGIRFQVGHIDRLSFFLDHDMFSGHEPTHVGEEEASLGVMGVRVGLRVLVVNSVISRPLVDAVLWVKNVIIVTNFVVIKL